MTKCASTIHRLIESLEDVAGAMHRMTFVDDAGNEASITYRRFAEEVFRQAGALRELDVRENDMVMLALPAVGRARGRDDGLRDDGRTALHRARSTRRATTGRQVIDVACELYRPRLVIAADAQSAAWRDDAFPASATRVVDLDTLSIVADAGARALISAKHGRDPHHVQLTSGSTSHPKAAVLSHENVIANVLGIGGSVRFDIAAGDGTASWLPLYHDMGPHAAVEPALPCAAADDAAEQLHS